jgi:hypothetical protein
MTNGNDGPFRDEGPLMSPPGEPTLEPGPLDADVSWVRDLVADCGIYTHDAAHTSPLLRDGRLYLNTGNGVDNTHRKIRCPDAPSLVVLDAATGRWLARDGEHIGPRIFHCTWSSPALLRRGPRDQIVFGGGDGIVYGFSADVPPGDAPAALTTIWRYDIDPTSPKENVHQYTGNRKESPSTCKAMPVVHEGRVYVVVGGDRWWGKPQTWMACLDPSGTGDVTKTAAKWVYAIDAHSMSTPSVRGGLVYVADAKGRIHCVDAATGKPAWVYESRGEMWGSTLVADGKVYAGNRRGDLHVLAEGRELKPLAVSRLDAPIAGTPVAANGTLYVPTAKTLYALRASPR